MLVEGVDGQTLPCVFWVQDGGEVGKHRAVLVRQDDVPVLRPEKRLCDDAMGQQAWQFVQWGADEKWVTLLLKELIVEHVRNVYELGGR